MNFVNTFIQITHKNPSHEKQFNAFVCSAHPRFLWA